MASRLRWAPVAVVTLVAAASTGLATIALFAYRPPHDVGRWEHYVSPWWWDASWLLVIPLFLATVRWHRVGLALVLCASVPQWFVARVVWDRYVTATDTNEIDGFFGLDAVLIAGGMTLAFAVAASLGSAQRRRQARLLG